MYLFKRDRVSVNLYLCVCVCMYFFFKSESYIFQTGFELTEGSLELLIFLFLSPVGLLVYIASQFM